MTASLLSLLAFQNNYGGEAPSAALGIGTMIFGLVIAVFFVFVMWKIYEKAGEPGWASIIPIYNFIVLLKIAGRPLWWIIIFPIAGLIIPFDLARKFGKGAGFGLGLLLLSFIFYPILAFGDATYNPNA